MKTIHVKRENVASIVDATFPNYKGTKFKLQEAESVTFHCLNWSNGFKQSYVVCTLSCDSDKVIATNQALLGGHEDQLVEGYKQRLFPGICVVMHTLARSKDLGLTIFLHPDNMPTNLVSDSTELTDLELLVLYYTNSYKSKYNGKDRYQMACEDIQYGYCGQWKEKHLPSCEDWEIAIVTLQNKGYLDKRKAITVEGKNALEARK